MLHVAYRWTHSVGLADMQGSDKFIYNNTPEDACGHKWT